MYGDTWKKVEMSKKYSTSSFDTREANLRKRKINSKLLGDDYDRYNQDEDDDSNQYEG